MNPNIAEYGKNTRFSSENQPKVPGAKKKVFNYLKEKYELRQDDLNNVIDYLSLLTKEEFENLAKKIKNNDEETQKMPMILLKIMQAYVKANLDDIIKLMRITGKATEKHELEHNVQLPVNITVKGIENN